MGMWVVTGKNDTNVQYVRIWKKCVYMCRSIYIYIYMCVCVCVCMGDGVTWGMICSSRGVVHKHLHNLV
jgi:dolichyl-phosphate-mannose--protein O-mannosyl transferase